MIKLSWEFTYVFKMNSLDLIKGIDAIRDPKPEGRDLPTLAAYVNINCFILSFSSIFMLKCSYSKAKFRNS